MSDELNNLREQLALSEANADQYRQQFDLAVQRIDGLEAQLTARHEKVGEMLVGFEAAKMELEVTIKSLTTELAEKTRQLAAQSPPLARYRGESYVPVYRAVDVSTVGDDGPVYVPGEVLHRDGGGNWPVENEA